MEQLTSLLKEAIVDDFGMHVLGLGFQPEKKRNEFYPYRRSGEERDEIIEVQFDKHNRPKFVLNFGVVPANGIIDAYGRFVSRKNVQIAHLVQHGRLYSLPYSMFWFSPNALFGFRTTKYSVEKAVAHLIHLFWQVERWFEIGELNPNIRLYTNQENTPGVRKKSMQERGVWPPESWTEEDEASLRM